MQKPPKNDPKRRAMEAAGEVEDLVFARREPRSEPVAIEKSKR